MATVKIKLTKDILSLVSNINFKRLPNLEDENSQTLNWGIDFFSLYGGSYLLEDIAYIIGKYDQVIQGTQEDAMGPRFPKELEDYMFEIHEYIVENIEYIESLVHQFCAKGGLTEGTYKCKDYQKIWTKIKE